MPEKIFAPGKFGESILFIILLCRKKDCGWLHVIVLGKALIFHPCVRSVCATALLNKRLIPIALERYPLRRYHGALVLGRCKRFTAAVRAPLQRICSLTSDLATTATDLKTKNFV